MEAANMATTDHFKAKALECRERAAAAIMPSEKEEWLKLAAKWEAMVFEVNPSGFALGCEGRLTARSAAAFSEKRRMLPVGLGEASSLARLYLKRRAIANALRTVSFFDGAPTASL